MVVAVLVGATGEVGGKIYQFLLEEEYYEKIYVLGRSSILKLADNKKVEKIVVDFECLSFDKNILNGADVFSALGTGSTGAFERIDYRYPLALASFCDNRVKSFNIVSAMGANPKSLSYYQKIKGRAEEDLKYFNLGILRIYRPSMLIAPYRNDLSKKEKVAIKFFQLFDKFFIWKIKNWRGITPSLVAKNMVLNAVKNKEQTVYKYVDMIKINKENVD